MRSGITEYLIQPSEEDFEREKVKDLSEIQNAINQEKLRLEEDRHYEEAGKTIISMTRAIQAMRNFEEDSDSEVKKIPRTLHHTYTINLPLNIQYLEKRP